MRSLFMRGNSSGSSALHTSNAEHQPDKQMCESPASGEQVVWDSVVEQQMRASADLARQPTEMLVSNMSEESKQFWDNCTQRAVEQSSRELGTSSVEVTEQVPQVAVEPESASQSFGRRFSQTFDKLGFSSKEECVACAAEASTTSTHWTEIRRLLKANYACLICGHKFCKRHCEFFPFPRILLPEHVGQPYVCFPCKPQAQQLLDDDLECERAKRITKAQWHRSKFAERRLSQNMFGSPGAKSPMLVAVPEQSRQCIECGSHAEVHCEICGIAICAEHLNNQALSSGSKAPGRLTTCANCVPHARALAQSRSAVRRAVSNVFRNALAAKCLDSCLARIAPGLELAEDCAVCGMMFTIMPGSLRHHCRACGRSLCSSCLCGRQGCLAQGPRCPHKSKLPQYGYEKEERMCVECLPIVRVRLAARTAAESIVGVACKYADHCVRVVAFMDDANNVPFYTQEFVDTTKDKLYRAGSMAVEGAKLVAPVLSVPWALGVRAVDLAWKYGQYGLVGLLCQSEIMEGLKTLLSFSAELQNIQPRDLLVGMIYLSAEQRKALRDDPECNRRETMSCGVPLSPVLLEVLIGLAVLGLRAPYEDNAFEAQRFALQQGWRLVTERLSESWKHRPAWCLYINQQQHVATLAVRGTDIEQSCGGDLFTNINVLPDEVVGVNGMVMAAHGGMLAAARALESELRPTFRALVRGGYRIAITGHSLGAAVAALLVWLLHYGDDGERIPPVLSAAGSNAIGEAGSLMATKVFGIGYGTPSCVDRATAEFLRPIFTSVVNSVDVIPRLSTGSLTRLTDEITECARESGSDLDQDVKQYVERLSTVWAPRLREGTTLPGTGSSGEATSSLRLHATVAEERFVGQRQGLHRSDDTGTVSSVLCLPVTSEGRQMQDLFVPGNVVWIHRVCGHLEVAVVPCDLPALRRIVLDKRMMTDHRGVSYHEALRAVRARQAAEASAPQLSWQGFSNAGDICPCCGSKYEWMNTARSGKSRVHAMTNCRACGLVVCIGCAETRRTIPEQGILHPARICDRCAWRGGSTDVGEALHNMPRLFSQLAHGNSKESEAVA